MASGWGGSAGGGPSAGNQRVRVGQGSAWASLRLPLAAVAGMSGQDKSLSWARGTLSHTAEGESGYVVLLLLLLTGLPPFMMADALVLLLGVTPAFGTVSPTSCKDGSRYMATSNGLGRK